MSTSIVRSRYDALIVGGRCAGAATALLLARRGLRVLVVEKGAYGADAVSTHALMRGGVLQLARWGLLPAVRASGAPPVRTATFYYGDQPVPVEVRPSGEVDALYAPRRIVLDRLLVDAARQAGAEFSFGTRLVELSHGERGRVTGASVLVTATGQRLQVDAGVVIGADGIHSVVAQQAEARVTVAGKHASASVLGYFSGLDLEGYHFHYAPAVSAGVISTNGGHCVFVSLPPARLQQAGSAIERCFDDVLLESSAPLAARLAGARREGGLRRFAGVPGYLRQPYGPGWALVGDAGYFKDPLTAHGITDALRDAELLADAVAAGTELAMERYQATRDELSLPLFQVTDRIASMTWSLSALSELHLKLSEAMREETRFLSRLDSHRSQAA